MEKERDPQDHAKHVKFLRVKRIRDVGQSFLTALMFRAPRVFKQTLQIVYEENPSGVRSSHLINELKYICKNIILHLTNPKQLH